jgi:FixJ family two-component response regulator
VDRSTAARLNAMATDHTLDAAPLNVYVVDDDDGIRSLVSKLLVRAGFEAHAFATADEARLAIARVALTREPVDAVLLDMRLEPASESTQQAEDLLASLVRRQPQPEVVVMSGHLSPNEFFRLMLRGARDFVLKPWNAAELVTRVRDAASVGREKYRHHWTRDHRMSPARRDAFLSYSTRNGEMALGLKRILERMGVSTWYAAVDLPPGESWPDALDSAIHTCSVFLVLLTEDALASAHVLGEIQKAIARKSLDRDEFLLIPVTYGVPPRALPEPLGRFQAVDLTDEHAFVDNVIQLAHFVTQFLCRCPRAADQNRRRVERRVLPDRRIA